MITPAQIRAGRAMINAKQSELAKAAGVSLATLNNIERGSADPRVSTLDSIERALLTAGVETDSDETGQLVRLNDMFRPSIRETLHASQRILSYFDRASLLKPQRIIFFAQEPEYGLIRPHGNRWASRDVSNTLPDAVLGIMIEGTSRIILFDQVALSIETTARSAEVAGIVLAAYAVHRDAAFFIERKLPATLNSTISDAVGLLRGEPLKPLKHPASLFDILGGWQKSLDRAQDQPGHPIHSLAAFA